MLHIKQYVDIAIRADLAERSTLRKFFLQGEVTMNLTDRKVSHFLLAAVVMIFGSAPGAYAQQVTTLEEIVVTAQRRAESIQDVPISINAVSGEELKSRAINNTFDLQAKVPGFVSTPVSSFNFNYLRGVGTDQQTVGLEPAVATHIDGVYFPRVASGLQELYDVDRVEVIKGPQGTLFGRNATGGIMHVITRRPDNELGGYVDITVGDFDKRRIEAALNVPLADDKALLRIAAVHHEDEGFSRNEYLGLDEDNTDFSGARAQLLIKASDSVDIRIFGDFAKNDGGRGAASHPSEPFDNLALGVPGGEINSNVRINRRDAAALAEIDDWGIGMEVNWELANTTFTSLTSYRELENRNNVDFDLTPLNFSGFSDALEKSEAWMQEFQLASNSDGSWDWVIGLFLLGEDVRQDYQFPFATSVFGGNPAGPAVEQGGLYDAGTSDLSIVDTSAQAIFAQASYAFDDKWQATFGIRLSQEEREIDYSVSLLDIATPATAADLIANRSGLGAAFISDAQKDDWDAVTPKLGIEYKHSDDVMYYFSATRGFKSGGYNGILFGAATTLEAVDPEFIWSYEAGVKSTLLDGRMRLNIAAFYYDYTDIQLNILTAQQAQTRGFANVRNAGDATINGIEVEWLYAPNDNFEISALLAGLDSELDNLIAANPNNPADTDQTGNRLPNSPEFTATIGAAYNWDLANQGRVSLRGDYTYRGKRFHTVFNDFFDSSASYDMINARIAYTSPSEKWSLGLYGRNLADEEIESFGFRAPFFGALKLYGERRNYGVTFRYSY